MRAGHFAERTGLDPAAVLMGVYRPDPGMEFTFPISA
jgi:hypothetical protein